MHAPRFAACLPLVSFALSLLLGMFAGQSALSCSATAAASYVCTASHVLSRMSHPLISPHALPLAPERALGPACCPPLGTPACDLELIARPCGRSFVNTATDPQHSTVGASHWACGALWAEWCELRVAHSGARDWAAGRAGGSGGWLRCRAAVQPSVRPPAGERADRRQARLRR